MLRLALIALFASACGKQTKYQEKPVPIVPARGDSTWDHQADTVVFDAFTRPGFVPQYIAWGAKPTLRLFGDGRMIGASASGLIEAHLDSADMQTLVNEIEAAGLLTWESQINTEVTDGSTEVLTLHVGTGSHMVTAYVRGTGDFRKLYDRAAAFFERAGTPYTPTEGTLFVETFGQTSTAQFPDWPSEVGVSLASTAALADKQLALTGEALTQAWAQVQAHGSSFNEGGTLFGVALIVPELQQLPIE